MKVSVDVSRLRESASQLDDAPDSPTTVTVGMGDLGSSRSDSAFEQFYPTWTSECSVAEGTIEELSGALQSAAETYARRDADAATKINGGPIAF